MLISQEKNVISELFLSESMKQTVVNADMHSNYKVWCQFGSSEPNEPTDYSNMGYLRAENNILSVDL